MALADDLTARAKTYVADNKDKITDSVAKAERMAYAKAPVRYHPQIGNAGRTVRNVVEKLAAPPKGPT